MNVKRVLGTLALGGGMAIAAMAATTPAHATSCFYEDQGQNGSSRCFEDNVQDFRGMKFPNGHDIHDTASSWTNQNTILNEDVYSEPGYQGQNQELEDETSGNLDGGIDNHLGSFDAA